MGKETTDDRRTTDGWREEKTDFFVTVLFEEDCVQRAISVARCDCVVSDQMSLSQRLCMSYHEDGEMLVHSEPINICFTIIATTAASM